MRSALARDFGSFKDFETEFVERGSQFFGSGWIWLVSDKLSGVLSIVTTKNEKIPLKAGRVLLLNCDLWEHAYYIDYRNRKNEFLKGFVERIDFNFVNKNFNRK